MPEHERCRPEVAERVDEYRDGGRHELDQSSGEPRAGELRSRTADLELGVPLDQLVAIDERREERLVRNVEEHGADPGDERHDVELHDVEDAEAVGERDGSERDGPSEVPGDQDRSAPHPVDPHARRQPDDEERQELRRAQQTDLERRRVQHDHGRQRKREEGDLRAELAHRLGAPELHEPAVAPQAPRILRRRARGVVQRSVPRNASSISAASGTASRRSV
jgi:hypothetical protein